MASGQQWGKRSVKELQKYLKDRGIAASKERKASLVELCVAANELGVEIDPDYLIEDREDVIAEKLLTATCTLRIPSIIAGHQHVSSLPLVTIIDIYNYLVRFDGYTVTGLREYKRMEAYGMYRDGHVKNLNCFEYNEAPTFYGINAQVKPRTKEKDPITKRDHYSCWLILTRDTTGNCSIHSGYCSCKGGMDGACRHIATLLFEIMEFQNDDERTSVTSGPCVWKRKSGTANCSIVVTALKTALSQRDTPTQTSDFYCSIPEGVDLPKEEDFFDVLRMHAPNACLMDTVQVRDKTYPTPTLDVMAPIAKIQVFFSCHGCQSDGICSETCFDELYDYLHYTPEEISVIEVATRGQHLNNNWHEMRKGILTSSTFKKICHSVNLSKTSVSLLNGSSLDENHLPYHIKYGRQNEEKARKMFITGHRYHHKQASIIVPGLIINAEEPFLAASPDGILHCEVCSSEDILIEIKCLSSHRNFHPKTALVMSKICFKNQDDNLEICHGHQYFYQIQGQLAVTGLKKCILVAYTNKGITCVDVYFQDEFWNNAQSKLKSFFEESYLNVMKGPLIVA